MIELNKKRKVKVGVNYNRRFSKNFSKMKEAIVGDRIGKVECLRISSRDPSPAPMEYLLASGGIHKDCTIHDFDMSNYLMGQTPVKVFAQGSALFLKGLEGVDYDTAVTLLTYSDGQMCVIENSRRTGFNYDQRVEVFGQRGALVNSNKAPNEVEEWGNHGRRRDLGYEFFLDYYQDAIRDSLNAFLDYAQDKRQDHVTLDDARNALRIAQAAQESARTGKQVYLS